MKEDIKILENAIRDIEYWKGEAYMDGDDVDLALKDIEEVINRLKEKSNGNDLFSYIRKY